jgi:hypothetical protein
MGSIFTNVRFQSGNLRESGKAERVGNIWRTMRVLGSSGERVQISAEHRLGIGFQKLLRLDGLRVGPSNGNRDWFDHRFCRSRWRLDITSVKRKDGGRGLFYGRGGLLRFEPEGSCDGVKLF